MKYIIEIEDEPFGRNDDLNIPHGMDELYRAKGFKSLVFDQFGLDKLTPLDKALSNELGEAYHKGFEAGQHEATTLEYQRGLEDGKKQAKAQAELDVCHDIEKVAREHFQKGLEDAWECAKKLFSEMSNTEINLVFPHEWNNGGFKALMALDPKDAIDRINAFERKQKSDEIKVGDEIKNTLELMNNAVGYFIEPTNNEYYRVLRYVNGKIDIVAWHKENCVRTGKHSYAVERMYVVLKDEQSCSSCEYCNDPDGVRCRDCCGYNKWEPKGGED